MVYAPREDSFLLQKFISKYAKGNVLDMGTGSGILAIEAAKQKSVRKVLAIDIDERAIGLARRNANSQGIKKIKFLKSDLLKSIKGKFGLIIFNPPYLLSKKINDIAVDGGKNGTEIIEKFLGQAKEHLAGNGKILILASSLNKNIEQLFKKHNYCFKKLKEQKLFMEQLFVYELWLNLKN